MSSFIKNFNQISKDDVKDVGGKGASLSEMTQAGIPVPPGFVVTTETYKQFINDKISVDVEQEILKAFDDLGAERVAVRSSAVAEDSGSASWAGQLESYLNVTRDKLIENIRNCWNSIKSERALSYASQQNINEEDLVVAVVVQKMVNSEVSGVMFTVNPITKDTNEIMIEAVRGLGELIVQGMVTPDNFLIIKRSLRPNGLKGDLKIKSKDIQSQEIMMVYQDGENKEVEIPANLREEQVISDEKVKELAQIGINIENHYGFPCDIEWAMEDGVLYIVQSRPITTF